MKPIPQIAIAKPWLRNQRVAGRSNWRPFLVGIIIGTAGQLLYYVFEAGRILPQIWR